MEKVRIDDVDTVIQPCRDMRPLTRALGASDLAINYYELDPGDSFAYAYHAHGVQEELFYVQEGTATFDTEDGSVTVEAGEVVRFPPGEYQRGWNRGEETVVALALGAPLEYGDIPKYRDCEACGEATLNRLEYVEDGEARVALCEECGAETGRWTLDDWQSG